jgi:hypothetical protein
VLVVGGIVFLLFAGDADAVAYLDIGQVSEEGIGLIIAFIPELEAILRGDGASGQGRWPPRHVVDADAERCAYRYETDKYFGNGGIK